MKTKPNLKRVAKAIARELLTMNHETPIAKTGHRLAVMAGTPEQELGGRCRVVVEQVILKHLKNMVAARNK